MEYEEGYYVGTFNSNNNYSNMQLNLSLDTNKDVTGITDTMETVNPTSVALHIGTSIPARLAELTRLSAEIEELKKGRGSTPAKIGYVDLLSANWEGSGNLYSQVVTIEGVTERSQVDLTPNVEQLAIFYEKDLTFVTENDGGVVTVYAIGQKPQNDYTIQVTITEVNA